MSPNVRAVTHRRGLPTGVWALLTFGFSLTSCPAAHAHGGGYLQASVHELVLSRSAPDGPWRVLVQLEDVDSLIPIESARVRVSVTPRGKPHFLTATSTPGSFAGTLPAPTKGLTELTLGVTTEPGSFPVLPFSHTYEVDVRGAGRIVVVHAAARAPAPPPAALFAQEPTGSDGPPTGLLLQLGALGVAAATAATIVSLRGRRT